MSIIYILTVIFLFTSLLLIYKNEKKENFLKSLSISIMTFMCYNVLICLLMSLIKVESTLITYSIFNTIIAIIQSIKIYKDKKIQKFFINKIDILVVLFIFCIAFIVFYNRYGIPINIKNDITDASVHYYVADEFYNTSMLLYNNNSDIFNIWKVDFFMPAAYVNTGIVFKIFSNIFSETFFCELYITFDMLMWCLSGILFYSLLGKKQDQNKKKILPFIFSIIYMLGYPLNSLLSGFSYLSVGLNIIISILIVIDEDNQYYKYILLSILNFGLFFSYYFFVPVVYFAIFLQIIFEKKKNSIVKIIYSLALPSIFGILFFVIMPYLKFNTNFAVNSANTINMAGSIYSNYITNIAIFLVISICYMIKNKKNDISEKMLILTIAFLVVLFIGNKLNLVSTYYYYKTYFLLWIFLLNTSFKYIDNMNDKHPIITQTLIGIYCFGIIISMFGRFSIIGFDIYRYNSDSIKREMNVVSHEELEILDYYNKNINTDKLDKETYMCLPLLEHGRSIWIYAITKNPYNLVDLSYGDNTIDIQQFKDSEKKYFVLFKEDYLGDYNNMNLENLDILFENEAGMILVKN